MLPSSLTELSVAFWVSDALVHPWSFAGESLDPRAGCGEMGGLGSTSISISELGAVR